VTSRIRTTGHRAAIVVAAVCACVGASAPGTSAVAQQSDIQSGRSPIIEFPNLGPVPADGITLDEAIDRLMAANLDIRALRHELPQADADIITAGLRTNPLVSMDTQFIPYGSFTEGRPGGPTHYDLNITYPIDVSQKRKARVVVARMARSALEARFQDVVRRQLDNLYRGFVSLQAARIGLVAPPPPPPALDELTRIAMECRPDLRSQRAGVGWANAEVALQRANRFDDVYLFYDPIIYQDNRPIRAASAHSWAVGLTFSLPISNRNQGNIARATSNLQQTRNELSSLERGVVSEVRLAEREFQASKRALDQIERTMLPLARESLGRQSRAFTAGDLDADEYQACLDEAAALVGAHRDAIIRHRRAMLDLNTAVGMRIML
jgi:outer membrane protein TolC